MRVLIAPDSFKGSLTAIAAAKAIGRGVLQVFPDAVLDIIAMADGGEGTVEALVNATGGTLCSHTVQDPLGRPVEAIWGLLGSGKGAVVEMAAASGLPLLSQEERAPLITSTFGTGELIAKALEAIHQQALPASGKPLLVIGIGGSATNDGGAGALEALGVRFYDAAGKILPRGGGALANLAKVDFTDIHPLLARTEILVACDVDTPLCGSRGASAVFGPQKGACPETVQILDQALAKYAKVSAKSTGKDIAEQAGAGAAGGLGAGLLFYTPAKLIPGVDLVLETTDFSSRAALADLVITGEGQTDRQTIYGKAPVGVAKCAKKHGKPVLCLSGSLGENSADVYEHGIDALASLVCTFSTIQECLQKADELLQIAAERACRLLALGQKLI